MNIYIYIYIYRGGVPSRAEEGTARESALRTRLLVMLGAPVSEDIFKGAPLGLPKSLSDQFPVRVCACPLCI